MIRRLRKRETPKPSGRPAISRAGDRITLRERLGVWFGLSGGPTAGEPVDKRRGYITIGLIVYLSAVVVLGLAYNLPILAEQRNVRRQVESGAVKVASMQRVTGQLDAERERYAELVAERERLYRELPAAVDLPVVVERLKQLPTWSGGTVGGVEYAEPRWSGGVGQMQTHAALNGSLREVAAYIAALERMLPASTLERVSVRLNGEPGRVYSDVLFSVGAIRERPGDAPEWALDEAWARAGTAARGATVAGSPFTPGARLWQQAREARIDLPELRLAGIARSGGEAVALVVYGGEGRLVRSGSKIGQFRVAAVDAAGVVLEIDDRVLRLDAAGALPSPGAGEPRE